MVVSWWRFDVRVSQCFTIFQMIGGACSKERDLVLNRRHWFQVSIQFGIKVNS